MWPWAVEHWEFIFGVLGLIGVVVSIIAWLQQRQPKQLDYEVRSKIRLLGSHADAWRGQFYFSYKENPIDDPWVSIVRVRNTGKKSISQNDFSKWEPIKLFAETGELVDRQIVGASQGLDPKNLAEVYIDEDDYETVFPVVITTKLLNPGEWFDVQVISEGGAGELSVTARFADRRRPMKRIDWESPERLRNSRRLAVVTMATAFVFLLLAILAAPGPMLDINADVSTLLETSLVASILSLLAIVILPVGFVLYLYTFVKRV